MRRATWILWLMLALLPLRGWAAATMGVPAIDASTAAAAMSAEASDSDRTLPCHTAAGDDGGPAGNCQACDWCHAALGLPADATLTTAELPAAPPRVSAASDTGRRLIGGLDRPPRNLLA